ncbi:MAG: ornithine carbamoyltransferase [Planctomycetota bacterium]
MTKNLFGRLAGKDLVSIADLSRDEIDALYACARALKEGRDTYTDLLQHRRLAMIFEKDSLRTRFTFDVGMQDLGGSAVFMDHRDARLGSRESLKDMARNLERWVDGIVARTYRHRAVVELAQACRIPVINGLSELLHPCQALTDYFTLTEKLGDLRGRRLVYVGDGNNTCHSLLHAGARLGVHVTTCSPEGYEPNARVVAAAMEMAHDSGAEVRILNDVDEAVDGADCIYTDVWASMGQEDEIEERASAFEPYQVDEAMLQKASPDVLFLHCLPAHRGAEVTTSVIDGPHSIVFDNAENRLHVQKAIMVMLMGQTEPAPAVMS